MIAFVFFQSDPFGSSQIECITNLHEKENASLQTSQTKLTLQQNLLHMDTLRSAPVLGCAVRFLLFKCTELEYWSWKGISQTRPTQTNP